jgi:hypothetical protein
MLSLGNMTIAVDDETNMLDLYGLGFNSSLLSRQHVTQLTFYPGAAMSLYHDENSSGVRNDLSLYSAGTGQFASNDGLQLFFPDDAVLVLKPILSFASGSGGDTTYFNSVPGGEASISFGIGNGMSAAVAAGYMRQVYNTGGETLAADNTWFDKMTYDLSISFLPEKPGDWGFALSAGNRTVPELAPLAGISTADYGSSLAGRYYFYYDFNSHTYSKNAAPGLVTENYTDDYTNGYQLSAGAANTGNEGREMAVKAGVIFGLSAEERSKTLTTDPSTGESTVHNGPVISIFINGLGGQGQFGLKTKINGVPAGILGSIYYIGGMMWQMRDEFLSGRVSAGASFGSPGFLVPVELSYERMQVHTYLKGSDTRDASDIFTVKAGNEIGAGAVTVRYGVDCAAYMENSSATSYGIKISGSFPAGTPQNPFIIRLGCNGGTGFKDDNTYVNIGARVEPQWTDPAPEMYKYQVLLNVSLYSDVKFYF